MNSSKAVTILNAALISGLRVSTLWVSSLHSYYAGSLIPNLLELNSLNYNNKNVVPKKFLPKAIVRLVDINKETNCQASLKLTLPNHVAEQERLVEQPRDQTTSVSESGTLPMVGDDQAMRET